MLQVNWSVFQMRYQVLLITLKKASLALSVC